MQSNPAAFSASPEIPVPQPRSISGAQGAVAWAASASAQRCGVM